MKEIKEESTELIIDHGGDAPAKETLKPIENIAQEKTSQSTENISQESISKPIETGTMKPNLQSNEPTPEPVETPSQEPTPEPAETIGDEPINYPLPSSEVSEMTPPSPPPISINETTKETSIDNTQTNSTEEQSI